MRNPAYVRRADPCVLDTDAPDPRFAESGLLYVQRTRTYRTLMCRVRCALRGMRRSSGPMRRAGVA